MVSHAISSSFITLAEYEEQSEVLTLYFKNGSSHSYYGVSKELFQQFMDSGSKGQFLNQILKNYG